MYVGLQWLASIHVYMLQILFNLNRSRPPEKIIFMEGKTHKLCSLFTKERVEILHKQSKGTRRAAYSSTKDGCGNNLRTKGEFSGVLSKICAGLRA